MVEMGAAMREYWKDSLGIELDVLKRESGTPRRYGSQFYRISLASWIPDPAQIFRPLLPDLYGYEHHPDSISAFLRRVRSVPLADPEPCSAFENLEERYLDHVYMIPIREIEPIQWVVQPWLVGFESTFNLDFSTLTTA